MEKKIVIWDDEQNIMNTGRWELVLYVCIGLIEDMDDRSNLSNMILQIFEGDTLFCKVSRQQNPSKHLQT